MTLVEKAKVLALSRHQNLYDGLPYGEAHLAVVVSILERHGLGDEFLAGGWLHDIIEDTATTLEELVAEFGETIALDVWAVTGVGENRRARNAAIYEKIAARPRAAVLKLADRIANARGHLIEMYRKEMPAFEQIVRPHVPTEMWVELEAIFSSN